MLLLPSPPFCRAPTPPTSTTSTPATSRTRPRWTPTGRNSSKACRTLPADVQKNAEGPSWGRDNWPVTPRDELTSALDGNWAQVEKAVGNKIAAKAQGKGLDLSAADVHQATRDSVRALMLIRAYRMRGHFHAKLDPLGIEAPRDREELDPRSYGFTEADFDRKIFLDHVLSLEYGTLREIVAICERTYCQTLGVEFMHITNAAQKAWIQERIEGPDKEISFTREGRRAILNKLVEAEGFEKFCDVKFTGTKRFGLDGGESLIPALEQIIKRGGNLGVKEIVFGMPHRGRLNVLTQVMGKPHRALFHEFKGGSANPDAVEGSGDVKYHLGASSDREFDNNKIHLSLTANPSHLEIVDPVVLGKVRAKQDQHGDPPDQRISVLPILMHGDAAFAGQGVVAECFSLSDLKGYRTGGSLHFIVNNQIGFTTYPRYSRSSPYPSDAAKMIDAPIFHVNGDDPEAVVFAAKVAIEFRQKFHKPVVIDMFCHRRHGHNEGDEPAFTQPVMYKKIASLPTTLEIYAKRLIVEGVMTEGEVEKAKADWRARLDAELEAGSGYKPNKADWLDGKWAGFKSADQEEDARRGITGVDVAVLTDIGRKITKVPDGFRVHRTIQRFLENRAKAIDSGIGIDWATGEALAFCTLMQEGHHAREFLSRGCELMFQIALQRRVGPQALNRIPALGDGLVSLADGPVERADGLFGAPGKQVARRLEREHQPLKALQQRVVQLARDARTLVDARLQAHVELPLQLPDTELVEPPTAVPEKRPRRERETNSSGSTPGRWRTPACRRSRSTRRCCCRRSRGSGSGEEEDSYTAPGGR